MQETKRAAEVGQRLPRPNVAHAGWATLAILQTAKPIASEFDKKSSIEVQIAALGRGESLRNPAIQLPAGRLIHYDNGHPLPHLRCRFAGPAKARFAEIIGAMPAIILRASAGFFM